MLVPAIAQVFLGSHSPNSGCYKQYHWYVVRAGDLLHAEDQGGFLELSLSHPEIEQSLTAPQRESWPLHRPGLLFLLAQLSHTDTEERLETSASIAGEKELEVQRFAKRNAPLSGLFNSY